MTKMSPKAKILFALLFIVGGINHFVSTAFYVRMMPPYLPWPRELVWVSGVCEFVLGSLLLVPRTSRRAALGLILLLIAVFPANLHMAMHADEFADFSALSLWLRLPVQALLVFWAYSYTRVRTLPPG